MKDPADEQKAPRTLTKVGKDMYGPQDSARLHASIGPGIARLGLCASMLSLSMALGSPSTAQEAAQIPPSPDDISSRIERDNRPKDTVLKFPAIDRAFQPWNEWKAGLAEKGFRLGFDYNAVGQTANNMNGESEAVGGIFRAYFSWDILNRGNLSRRGALEARAENRHGLGTKLPPQDLAPNFGWAGASASNWSDQQWGLPVFWWRQRLDIGETPFELGIGRVDPFSYFDVVPYGDIFTKFTNNSIVLSPTIAYPSAGAMGTVGYVGFQQSNLYTSFVIADANGNFDELGFESLEEGEFFKGIEFGWVRTGVGEASAQYLFNNAHISLWQSDERGWGAGLTGSYHFDDARLGIFGRVAAAYDNPATLYDQYVGVGLTKGVYGADEIGLGASWGRVTGTDEEQVVAEAYYRWQLTQNVAITPSVQLLSNPAFNTDDDTVMVFGLRARITL